MQTRNFSKYLLHFAITFFAVLAAIFLYKFIEKPTAMTDKMDAQQIDAIRAQANIANGFEIASRFKNSIDVYWQMNNQMPTNNKAINVPEPDAFAEDGDVVERAEVVAQGAVKIVYNEQSGIDNGVIYFIPDATHAQTAGLQWHCVSPDFADITRSWPAATTNPVLNWNPSQGNAQGARQPSPNSAYPSERLTRSDLAFARFNYAENQSRLPGRAKEGL